MLLVESETMETTTTGNGGRGGGIDCLPPLPSMSHHHLSHQQHVGAVHLENPKLVLKQHRPPSTRSLPATTSSCLKQTGSLSPGRRQHLAKTASQSSSRSVTFDEDAVTIHTILSASSLSTGPKSDLFYSPRELEIMQENSIQREEERRYQEERKLMFERKAQRARRKAEKKAKAERKAKRRSASGRSSCSEEDASHYSIQSLPVLSMPPVMCESRASQLQNRSHLSTRSEYMNLGPRGKPFSTQKPPFELSRDKIHHSANRIVQIYRPGETMHRPTVNTARAGQVPSMHRIFPNAAGITLNKPLPTEGTVFQRSPTDRCT